MKPMHIKLAKANPAHYQRALERATMVVKGDRRLLGIPSVRPNLIEIAALRALGATDAMLDVQPAAVALDPENLEPMIEVLNVAIAQARESIADLPPVQAVTQP